MEVKLAIGIDQCFSILCEIGSLNGSNVNFKSLIDLDCRDNFAICKSKRVNSISRVIKHKAKKKRFLLI
jgi:hypothetical protein